MTLCSINGRPLTQGGRGPGTILVLGHYTIMYTVYQHTMGTCGTVVEKTAQILPNRIGIWLQNGTCLNNSLHSPVDAQTGQMKPNI